MALHRLSEAAKDEKMSGDALRLLVVMEYEECRTDYLNRFKTTIGSQP